MLSSHNLAGIYFAHPCADPLVLVEPVNQEVVEQDEDVEEGYAELGQRGGCHVTGVSSSMSIQAWPATVTPFRVTNRL